MILKEKKSSTKTRGYKSLLLLEKKFSIKSNTYKLLLFLEKILKPLVYTV